MKITTTLGVVKTVGLQFEMGGVLYSIWLSPAAETPPVFIMKVGAQSAIGERMPTDGTEVTVEVSENTSPKHLERGGDYLCIIRNADGTYQRAGYLVYHKLDPADITYFISCYYPPIA